MGDIGHCEGHAGVLVLAIISALASSQALGGQREEVLAIAYTECDKLLALVSPGDDLGPFYQSADAISRCKDAKYKEIFTNGDTANQ